jgi:hypothetical protein
MGMPPKNTRAAATVPRRKGFSMACTKARERAHDDFDPGVDGEVGEHAHLQGHTQ